MLYTRFWWRNTSDTPDLFGMNVFSLFLLIPSIFIHSWWMFGIGIFVLVASPISEHVFGIGLMKWYWRFKTMLSNLIWGGYRV